MSVVDINDEEAILKASTVKNSDSSITVVCPRCGKFRKVLKNTSKSDVLTEYCRCCGQHYSAILEWRE